MKNKVTIKSTDESGVSTVTKFGDTVKATLSSIYGFFYTPKSGSKGVVERVDGNDRVTAYKDSMRPSDVVEGGCGIVDENGNIVHLKMNNGIEIKSGSCIITLKNGEISINKEGMESLAKSLLTSDFASLVFDIHTHTSSSPGSPTSPPIILSSSIPTAKTSTLKGQ